MEKKSMKGYLYLMPALIIILLFTAYPLVRAFLMSVARKRENTSFFPGKLSLENANAESIAVASTPIVEKIVTIIVFRKYLGNGAAFHASA